jgi:hypothetical protein
MDQPTEPVETPSTEPTQPFGSTAFIAYVLALFIVDGLGFATIKNARSEFLMIALMSVIYGQIALAMVVGGLMGRNWLEGTFLSSLAVLCGASIGAVASGTVIEFSFLLYAATIPLICLMGAFPLILLRWTVGWQLQPDALLVTAPRSRLTIEDMILVPASLVAFWVMSLAPTEVDPNEMYWGGMSMAALPLLVVCVVFVLPCIYWAFRIKDIGSRWVLCLGYPSSLMIMVLVVVSAFNRGLPGEAIGWVVFGSLIASGVATLGMQLLYSGGYRLVNYKSAAVPQSSLEVPVQKARASEPSPFDLEPVTSATSAAADPQAANRKRHRIAVAGLLITTAIVNTGTWAYLQTRQKQMLNRIWANGGTVEMANGKPIKISFGPTTTQHELDEAPAMPTVKSISVAGTQVRAFYLRNNFTALESLDIRKTNLTPDEIWMRPSIEIIVSNGQFTDSELKEFRGKGLNVKQVEE